MDIKREDILKHLESLRKQREEAIAQVHAVDGALQDAEYWLSVLDKKEEK